MKVNQNKYSKNLPITTNKNNDLIKKLTAINQKSNKNKKNLMNKAIKCMKLKI